MDPLVERTRALSVREVSVLYGPLRAYPNLPDLFEDVIHALYSAYLRPGDLCVDGGAHVGRHTVPMAQLVGPGKVHAFEPIRELADHLAQNAIQAHARERVEIHVCALADGEGIRDFVSFYNPSDLYPGEYSGLRKRRTPEEWVGQTIRTPVTTLDSSLAGLTGLTFIKLDLEGGEYHALLGGERTIKSQRPVIAFESGGQEAASLYEYDADEFFGLFRRLDYELVDILGTRVTRDLWQHAEWLPWYLVAFPRELGWPDQMASGVNAVLQRHGFPPLYATPSAQARGSSPLDERKRPRHGPMVHRHKLRWKLLARVHQAAKSLSPAGNLGRVGRVLRNRGHKSV